MFRREPEKAQLFHGNSISTPKYKQKQQTTQTQIKFQNKNQQYRKTKKWKQICDRNRTTREVKATVRENEGHINNWIRLNPFRINVHCYHETFSRIERMTREP